MLAKPIWGVNGSVLIGAGVTLNERYIDRLKAYGVDYIFLEDAETSDIFPDDTIRDETRKKAVDTVYKTMMDLTTAPVVKRKVSTPNLGATFNQIFGDILLDLTSKTDLMFNLASLYVKEGYLFHHSVNVAVLSGIMGIAKGYNRNQLLELGVGALLFDIGMTLLPDELWQKDVSFTEEERERIKKHTEEGFELLRRQPDVSLLSAHCAFQHHERFDGTGYPRGLAGKEIHEYAQIVALADVYDALTSPRSYRKAYSPGEAIEFLYASGNRAFDLELIKTFCAHIAIYPVASTVMLNTGQIGVVTEINPLSSHRPVIRILREPGGSLPAAPYEIDLSKEYNVTITQTL